MSALARLAALPDLRGIRDSDTDDRDTVNRLNQCFSDCRERLSEFAANPGLGGTVGQAGTDRANYLIGVLDGLTDQLGPWLAAHATARAAMREAASHANAVQGQIPADYILSQDAQRGAMQLSTGAWYAPGAEADALIASTSSYAMSNPDKWLTGPQAAHQIYANATAQAEADAHAYLDTMNQAVLDALHKAPLIRPNPAPGEGDGSAPGISLPAYPGYDAVPGLAAGSIAGMRPGGADPGHAGLYTPGNPTGLPGQATTMLQSDEPPSEPWSQVQPAAPSDPAAGPGTPPGGLAHAGGQTSGDGPSSGLVPGGPAGEWGSGTGTSLYSPGSDGGTPATLVGGVLGPVTAGTGLAGASAVAAALAFGSGGPGTLSGLTSMGVAPPGGLLRPADGLGPGGGPGPAASGGPRATPWGATSAAQTAETGTATAGTPAGTTGVLPAMGAAGSTGQDDTKKRRGYQVTRLDEPDTAIDTTWALKAGTADSLPPPPARNEEDDW